MLFYLNLKFPRTSSWSLLGSLFETDFIAKIRFKYSGNSDAGGIYEQVIYILPGNDSPSHINPIL